MKQQSTALRMKSMLLCVVLLLASCGPTSNQAGTSATPTAGSQPTQALAPVTQAPDSAPAQPTQLLTPAEPTQSLAPTESSSIPIPTPAASFVVPVEVKNVAPPGALPGATYGKPAIEQEVQRFFELVYQARSLDPGGSMSVDALRRLVDGAYADYTIPLFAREVDDAMAGKLREVHFSDIHTTLENWQPAVDRNRGVALVTVTRTRTAVRSDRAESPQTATYQFRVERRPVGDQGVAWVATDFLNPATNHWVSEPATNIDQHVADQIQHFFEDFYAARTLTPGGRFDIDKTIAITQLSYQAYTLPLLERQQQEADEGTLLSVSYSDLAVQVLNYDPNATSHGGIATVEVTRTAHVTRSSGAEPPQTGVYRFRLHRHQDETGGVYWLGVDFFQPQAQRWVSEIAGMSVPVPPSGHG